MSRVNQIGENGLHCIAVSYAAGMAKAVQNALTNQYFEWRIFDVLKQAKVISYKPQFNLKFMPLGGNENPPNLNWTFRSIITTTSTSRIRCLLLRPISVEEPLRAFESILRKGSMKVLSS